MDNYDIIGKKYNLNRIADSRIVNKFDNLLEVRKGSLICDIGAGTGNYTERLASVGYKIDAIEPSIQMINQSTQNKNITWYQLKAEEISSSKKYDGAICSLAIHHFSDIDKSLSNIKRALKKDANFIIFCADPRKVDENCWFKNYFNEMIEKAKDSYLPIEILLRKLEETFKSVPTVEVFRIPNNITDGFFYAGWQTPERYLNKAFRNSISVFSKAPKEMVSKAIKNLEKDLTQGVWDSRYKKVRGMESYNGGYYFVKIKNKV